ncbi:OmpA family protein [Kiloniella laminariae]|uniref:OmpA family protein n=1 Tax=Kiloniella laminariae TaxID=454162 RepID=A0ABT4LIB1_9PROT|nr:OmpA family protein [Kiloniella laminariae]MCZ4280829.1 OmpA family protein [Kiloniella laminariae]
MFKLAIDLLENSDTTRKMRLLSCCTILAAIGISSTTSAQTVVIGGSGSSGVYVNEQLAGPVPNYANAYGGQAVPSGYPGTSDGQYLSRPGKLLFPPQNYPHSQVTVSSFAAVQTSGITSQQGWQQKPGATSSLYNPYGQPVIPLAQAKSNGYAQPKYPDQIPAFQPQSQLLVPPPAGRPQTTARVSAPKTQPAETSDIITPEVKIARATPTEAEATPAPAPKTVAKKAPPSIVPPAPTVSAETPVVPKTKIAKVPEPSTSSVSGSAAKVPAPKVATAPTEPVTITPIQKPAVSNEPATIAEDLPPAIPAAPSIASDDSSLNETTAELPPPPPPPAGPTPVETAALTSGGALAPMELTFAPELAELSPSAKDKLNKLADYMLENDTAVIQLLAYAGDNESNAQARRVSLSRALAVRGVLMDRGIQSTRMHVRALGNKTKDGNPDRVDIIPVKN